MRYEVRAIALLLAALLMSATPSGQHGTPPGGHQPGEEAAGNNLSYPAVFLGAPIAMPGTEGTTSLLGAFGVTWSYGCAVPDGEYANTSCVTVNPDGTFTAMTLEACQVVCGEGVTIDRIYWQKTSDSWQANHLDNVLPTVAAVTAAYFDWSDNLESVAWSASSTVRVESIPFVELATLDPEPQVGYGMWHVFSQGPDEVWGLRTSDATPPVPYTYVGAYGTVQGAGARLTFTKLETGVGLQTQPPDTSGLAWDPATGKWDNAPQNTVTAANAELNVGGKVIFGYNWNLKRFTMLSGVEKAGWWRLTFSTENNTIQFTNATITTPPPADVPALPTLTSFKGDLVRALGADGIVEPMEETGEPLFAPVVDATNHITYIDIYLKAAKGGGGGRGPR